MSQAVTVQSDIFDQIVNNLKDFPSARGDIIPKVMQMTADPNTAASSLSRVIASDPILTATVLRLSNSSFYGRVRSVTSLKEAVMILGVQLIRSLVVATAMSSMFKRNDPEGLEERLWSHALASAIAGRVLARELETPFEEEAYVAGLVQELAPLIMAQRYSNEYRPILMDVKKTGADLCAMESKKLGFTHCELGASLLDRWNFPDKLVEIVRYHHTPDDPDLCKDKPELANDVRQIAHIVCMSDAICVALGYGMYHPEETPDLGAVSSQHALNLSAEQIAEICEQTQTFYHEEKALFES